MRATRAIRRSTRDGRVFNMFLALVAVLVVGSGLTAKDGPRYGLIILQLAMLTAMALAFWLYPWLSIQQNKDLAPALASQTWHFGPDGVSVETGSSFASFAWSTVQRAVEDANYVLLFMSASIAHPIPKRALSAEQLSAFRSGLRAWLAERAQLLS